MSELSRDEIIKQPEDTTEFPYKKIILEKEESDSQVHFFTTICSQFIQHNSMAHDE